MTRHIVKLQSSEQMRDSVTHKSPVRTETIAIQGENPPKEIYIGRVLYSVLSSEPCENNHIHFGDITL